MLRDMNERSRAASTTEITRRASIATSCARSTRRRERDEAPEDQPSGALGHGQGWRWFQRRERICSAASWIENDGIVMHLTGAAEDLLMFDYPLTGTFEFSADVFDGGWAEGQVAYGGLIYEAESSFTQSFVSTIGRSDTLNIANHFSAREKYNQITVKVEPGKTRCYVNGHLFHEEDSPSPTSPWLALHSSAARRPTFRNLKITGTPTIPRDVKLSHGDRSGRLDRRRQPEPEDPPFSKKTPSDAGRTSSRLSGSNSSNPRMVYRKRAVPRTGRRRLRLGIQGRPDHGPQGRSHGSDIGVQGPARPVCSITVLSGMRIRIAYVSSSTSRAKRSRIRRSAGRSFCSPPTASGCAGSPA